MTETTTPNPRVSVVMSVYNDVGRLERAVNSVLGQSFVDLELIVVDDGSTDSSGILLDELAERDSRMTVLHQENCGLTIALIRGCALARGEFIARQDSDDWSHPTRIEEQIALIDSDPRIGFVSCPTQYVGPKDELLMLIHRSGSPEAMTHELLHERQGPPAHGSVIFRKSLYAQVGGYRQAFYFSQDSDLWLRMAEQAWIGYLPDTRYMAVREIDSTSGVQRPVQRRFGELAHRCREARMAKAPEQPWLDQANELKTQLREGRFAGKKASSAATAAMAYLLGSQLLRNGDARAKAYLWKSIRSRPLHWKSWVRMGQAILLGKRANAVASESK